MRWPGKMIGNPRDCDNTKYCTLHGDYDHLIEDCKHLMWEVNKLAIEGSLKEFFTSSGQGPFVGKEKRIQDTRSGVSEDQLEEEAVDATVKQLGLNNASKQFKLQNETKHS